MSQSSRGVIVLKDLSGPVDDAAADTIITLSDELGECVMKRSESILLRDGESIRMSTNRGILLVIGEAHVHPQPQEGRNLQAAAAGEGSGFFSSWLNWAYVPTPHNYFVSLRLKSGVSSWGTSSSPPLPPRTFLQHPHSLCAVFSTSPQDRGKLLHTWLERDSFIIETALNEFYAIAEFDLVEQRLEGYIFPKVGKSSSKLNKRFSFSSAISQQTDGAEAGHHFTIKKKALYPQPSSFSIAPDTHGKVFYLGFLPPSADRRPVVEVHAVPQFNPVDGTWSECSVIKRVVLRSLGLLPGATNGLTRSSFWVDFDDGTTVRNLKRSKVGPSGKFAWHPDEDVVRIRMKGDLNIPGITEEGESINMVTWIVTARPSPIQPSTISAWRSGREWAVVPDSIIHGSNVSPYANKNGEIDYEDVYPTPTYYTRPRDLHKFLNQLEPLPLGVELDTLEGANESGNYPPYLWVKNQEKINKRVYALFSKMSPGMLASAPEADAGEGHGEMFVEDLPKHVAYPAVPVVPGVNDGDFRPPGMLMKTKYKVELEVGRKIAVRDVQPVKQVSKKGKSRFLGRVRDDQVHASTDDSLTPSEGGIVELPVPGFNEAPRDRVLTRMDKMNKKFWVYGKEPELRRKGEVLEEPIGDRIVIVRFD